MQVSELARHTLAQMRAPDWRSLALVLFVLLTATNAVLAIYAPEPGGKPGLEFSIAGLVRALGLFSLSVALLRIGAKSPRGRWRTDGAFFLYAGISLIGFGFAATAAWIGQDWPNWARILLVELFALILFAPFARWMVAAAVERPLALHPAPWFARLGEWLPAYLVLALPLVVLAAAHAALSLEMLRSAGNGGFWLVAIADGLVSTLVALGGLGLRLAAYRGVARG
jgi:hypothetical protein